MMVGGGDVQVEPVEEPDVKFEISLAGGQVVTRLVPLTEEEKQQRRVDQEAAAMEVAAREQARTDRMALVVKLNAGTASDGEVQSALASLLGSQA